MFLSWQNERRCPSFSSGQLLFQGEWVHGSSVRYSQWSTIQCRGQSPPRSPCPTERKRGIHWYGFRHPTKLVASAFDAWAVADLCSWLRNCRDVSGTSVDHYLHLYGIVRFVFVIPDILSERLIFQYVENQK